MIFNMSTSKHDFFHQDHHCPSPKNTHGPAPTYVYVHRGPQDMNNTLIHTQVSGEIMFICTQTCIAYATD